MKTTAPCKRTRVHVGYGLCCLLITMAACRSYPRATPIGPYTSAPAGMRADRPQLPDFTINSDLDTYIRYALLNNPGLEAAFQDYVAAMERIPQVTALPDPRLSYRYYIQEVETRVGPQQHAFGLSQTLPWFGKLELQGQIASRAADAAKERFEAKKDSLVAEVIDAYLESWTDLAPAQELRRLLPAAERMSALHRAESWRRLMADVPLEAIDVEFLDAPAHWLLAATAEDPFAWSQAH